MVGSAIAAGLARQYEVTVVDRSPERLALAARLAPMLTRALDLSRTEVVKDACRGFDLAVGAVPGFMGYATLRAIIEAGVNAVDISFFDEDAFSLDQVARESGVTAIVDCGVAPGLSHMVQGYHAPRMQVDRYRCLVGGLPENPAPPWYYKAPFSPVDVLEEYTRPARLMEGGKLVSKPALSDPELVELPPVGVLEAFNTDGLRSLLRTFPAPDMVEKTLRYPGHIDRIRVLRDAGLMGSEPILVGGCAVQPLDVTAAMLIPQWRLEPGEAEFTIMEVVVEGVESGDRVRHTYRLHERTDVEAGISSMARTTGYTCTAAANLVLEGRFAEPGVSPPELVAARPGLFERILVHLAERQVKVTHEASVL
jgi:saccharopine dehydrogenase-like NADP-dependent oxidoreductase